ncbi:MAG: CIA30 family protein, partial [Rhodothermales bacterium]
DDGDEIYELGNTWQVIAEGSGTHAEIYFPQGGFPDSSRHFLALEGVRPREAESSQVVGVRVSVREAAAAADPNQEDLAADVSAFDGLAFAVKGTPGTYIVQIGSTLVQDFDFYNSYVEVAEDWQEYRIPFGSFRQEGFGQDVDWQSGYASHIAFFANLGGSFRFAVDDIRFYRE